QYYQFREYIDGTFVPACLTEANTFWSSFFFIMIISVFFLIPLCMLIVLYAMMARHLMADPGTSAVKDTESSNARARKQVVLMLGTVVLFFFICLIPFRVFTLWLIMVPEEQLQRLGMEGYYNILYFCRTMLYLNSAVNPILYNLMSSKFRDGFMKLCGLRRGEMVLIRRGTTSTGTFTSSHSSTLAASHGCNLSSMTPAAKFPSLTRKPTNTKVSTYILQDISSQLNYGDSDNSSVSQCQIDLLRIRPILGVADYHHEIYIDGSVVAVCLTQADTFWTALFFIMSIAVFFAFPLVILVVLYTIIARHLMTHPGIMAPASRNQDANPGLQHSVLRYRKQVVLMLGTVVLSFFVCLMPFRAFTLWIIVAPQEAVFSLSIETYYNILYFCRVMTYINSAVNPILYNIMSSKFRDGFFRLCCFRHKPNQDILLGRKGTFNTTSSTTTTTCSSSLQDPLWRRSLRNTVSDDRKFKRSLSHASDRTLYLTNATVIETSSNSANATVIETSSNSANAALFCCSTGSPPSYGDVFFFFFFPPIYRYVTACFSIKTS
ncbi:hypothetical protein L9F63_016251, partial [Diploptera punctata]